jgi:NTE family protein
VTVEPRIALVLSGGGARGAYEAGVLSYLLDELPTLVGRRVRFSIVSGTSVGAIHACFLAANAGEPDLGTRLARIWSAFELDSVYRVHLRDVLAVGLRTLGFGARAKPEAGKTPGAPQRIAGLFDVSPLERLILQEIPWERISANVAAGLVDSVAIAATEIRSGRTVIFVENREGKVERWARDPYVVAEPARLEPEHALASAAIPFFFPSIRIGPSFFCDGSLRLNTPLAPALRLGADRVLVIGVHYQRPRSEPPPTVPDAEIASPAFLAGKILNALLLDRVDYDADRLRLFNAILRQGTRVYGADFLDRINEVIVRERGSAYRVVDDFFIRPSKDLGAIAAECVAHRKQRGAPETWSTRMLLRLGGRDDANEADLLSYLYFDGCYAKHLIELGRADAAAERDKLEVFFRP